MQLSEEERRRRYPLIYDTLWESPRAHLSEIQGLQKKQAGSMLQEALEKQIIMGPQLRKKIF